MAHAKPSLISDEEAALVVTRVAEAAKVQPMEQRHSIDLSRNGIGAFTHEMVESMEPDIERIALSHNYLSSIPSNILVWKHLRYFTAKHNDIKIFPSVICELESLEILDLSHNQLKALPFNMSKMTSLRILSVRKNSIRNLPNCLGDMTMLKVLKVDGNPLHATMQRIVCVWEKSTRDNDFEVADLATTMYIKKFLKSAQTSQITSLQADYARFGPSGSSNFHGFHRPSAHLGPAEKPSQNVILLSPLPLQTPLTLNEETSDPVDRSTTPKKSLASSSLKMGSNDTEDSNFTIGIDNLTLKDEQENRTISFNRLDSIKELKITAANLSQKLKKQDLPDISTPQNDPRTSVLSSSDQMNLTGILSSEKLAKPWESFGLDTAKTLLGTVKQLEWVMASLAELGAWAKGSNALARAVRDADTHIRELAPQVQNGIDVFGGQESDFFGVDQIGTSAEGIVQAFTDICSSISKDIDVVLAMGPPDIFRTLLQLMYEGILALRVRLRRTSPDTPKLDTPATMSGSESPAKINTVSNLETTTHALSNWSEASPTIASCPPASGLSDNEKDRILKIFSGELSGFCKLILDSYRPFNKWMQDMHRMAEPRESQQWLVLSSTWSVVMQHAIEVEAGPLALHIHMLGDKDIAESFLPLIAAWIEFTQAIKSPDQTMQPPIQLGRGLSGMEDSVKDAVELYKSLGLPCPGLLFSPIWKRRGQILAHRSSQKKPAQ